MSPVSLFWAGYRAAAPLMFGVAPFGVVFGALAVQAGLSWPQTLGMSVLVIAGSSQFAAARLFEEGAGWGVIVFTTLIINARHLLYSATLAEVFRPLSLGWRGLLAYFMIDEVYAPTILRHEQGDLEGRALRWYMLGAGIQLASVWWAGTLLGVWAGDVLPQDVTRRLGFTLPLIFTAIVVPQLTTRPRLWAALCAGTASIVLAPLPHNLGLVIAAQAGIMAGVWAEGRAGAGQDV